MNSTRFNRNIISPIKRFVLSAAFAFGAFKAAPAQAQDPEVRRLRNEVSKDLFERTSRTLGDSERSSLDLGGCNVEIRRIPIADWDQMPRSPQTDRNNGKFVVTMPFVQPGRIVVFTVSGPEAEELSAVGLHPNARLQRLGACYDTAVDRVRAISIAQQVINDLNSPNITIDLKIAMLLDLRHSNPNAYQEAIKGVNRQTRRLLVGNLENVLPVREELRPGRFEAFHAYYNEEGRNPAFGEILLTTPAYELRIPLPTNVVATIDLSGAQEIVKNAVLADLMAEDSTRDRADAEHFAADFARTQVTSSVLFDIKKSSMELTEFQLGTARDISTARETQVNITYLEIANNVPNFNTLNAEQLENPLRVYLTGFLQRQHEIAANHDAEVTESRVIMAEIAQRLITIRDTIRQME